MNKINITVRILFLFFTAFKAVQAMNGLSKAEKEPSQRCLDLLKAYNLQLIASNGVAYE